MKVPIMALCQYTGIVNDLRGKLAGTIFSRNKSGSYCKPWAAPSNKRSYAQQQSKACLDGLAYQWSILGTTLRAQWNAFATLPPETDYDRWGNICYIDGWHWFCRINIRLRQAGLTTTTTPPTCGGMTQPTITLVYLSDISGGLSSCRFECAAGEFQDDEYVVVKIGIVPFAGRMSRPSSFYVVFLDAVDSTTTEVDFPTGVLLAFGLIRPGWRWFAEIFRQHDAGVRSIAWAENGQVQP